MKHNHEHVHIHGEIKHSNDHEHTHGDCSHCHEHHHNHGDHSHFHTHSNDVNTLSLSFGLILIFMIVEWVTGFLTNSLTLIADAGHMTNDAFSLLIALLAVKMHYSNPKVSKVLTLINAFSLVVVSLFILWEAVEVFNNPKPLIAKPMLIVATIGLVVNILAAKIMHGNHQHNINIQAAYWHVLADLFGSVIAIVAGLCAYYLDWHWVDTVASVILSIIILQSGVKLTISAYRQLHLNDTDNQLK